MQTSPREWDQERDNTPSVSRAFIPQASDVHHQQQPRRPNALRDITDLRRDLVTRVDAFRARQHALSAEREAAYDNAIHRIRAITSKWDSHHAERGGERKERPDITPESNSVDIAWERIWLGIVQMADGLCTPMHPSDQEQLGWVGGDRL